ncbi:MAG: ORF6N domain-containing protein [Bacteroidetes bacterium]|nr:ORF6N domain-containing protein [Bacteroidota bacterium]
MPDEVIINKIFLIRSQKVMLDKDLSILYGVTTGNLNKAIKRNLRRFPPDFMFQLTNEEFKNLIFQNGTSSWGGTRKLPYAFTEQGVAMLSSVLNSERAIDVNIRIIRIFSRLREMLLTHKDILLKLEQLEKQVLQNSDEIQLIFTALKQLLNPPMEPRKPIGFKTKE